MAKPAAYSNPNHLDHHEIAVDDDDDGHEHMNQLAVAANNANTQVVETPMMMSPSLFAGAMQGNLDIIRENQSHLSTRFTRTGNSVLHIASDFEQLPCVKEIIKLLGNDEAARLLKKGNNKGDTALHVAAKRGHLSIVDQLVNFAAAHQHHDDDVENDYHVTELLRMTNNKGNTALHEAARSGKVRDNAFCNMTFIDLFKDSGVVKFLAGKDSEYVYGPNLGGETPLYIAAESRRQVAAIAILRTCKSPSYQGPLGRTALHAAIISNSTVVTKEIMDRKGRELAWKKDEEGWTPLHWAAFYNHSSIVTQLVRYDKSLAYIPDDNGLIPLHVAGSRGNISAMISLVSNSPDCYDMVDKNGRNVIHHAVLNRQFGTVREVGNGPLFCRLVNEGDEDGNTPFHLNPDPFLPPGYTLPLGVDTYALNANGLTILQAVSRRHSFNKETMVEPIVPWAITRRPRKPSSAGITTPSLESQVKRSMSAGETSRVDDECEVEGERFKVEMDSHLIVAALVATVAFTAGFTAPGGYDDQTGVAKLYNTLGFQCFIVFDAFALILSFSAILLYFNSVFHMYKNKLLAYVLVSTANLLTLLGIFSTVIAFVAAVASTTGSTVISVTIIISGVVFFVFYFGILLFVIGRFVFRGHSFWGLLWPPLGLWNFRVTLGDYR